MWTLVTDQGTATSETGLCDVCFGELQNQIHAREEARKMDDIDPNKGFIKCSGNEAINCCVCGESERRNAKIDRWHICLIDENGAEEILTADLPDDITERIDEMIEAEYPVTWTGDGTT